MISTIAEISWIRLGWKMTSHKGAIKTNVIPADSAYLISVKADIKTILQISIWYHLNVQSNSINNINYSCNHLSIIILILLNLPPTIWITVEESKISQKTSPPTILISSCILNKFSLRNYQKEANNNILMFFLIQKKDRHFNKKDA